MHACRLTTTLVHAVTRLQWPLACMRLVLASAGRMSTQCGHFFTCSASVLPVTLQLEVPLALGYTQKEAAELVHVL